MQQARTAARSRGISWRGDTRGVHRSPIACRGAGGGRATRSSTSQPRTPAARIPGGARWTRPCWPASCSASSQSLTYAPLSGCSRSATMTPQRRGGRCCAWQRRRPARAASPTRGPRWELGVRTRGGWGRPGLSAHGSARGRGTRGAARAAGARAPRAAAPGSSARRAAVQARSGRVQRQGEPQQQQRVCLRPPGRRRQAPLQPGRQCVLELCLLAAAAAAAAVTTLCPRCLTRPPAPVICCQNCNPRRRSSAASCAALSNRTACMPACTAPSTFACRSSTSSSWSTWSAGSCRCWTIAAKHSALGLRRPWREGAAAGLGVSSRGACTPSRRHHAHLHRPPARHKGPGRVARQLQLGLYQIHPHGVV